MKYRLIKKTMASDCILWSIERKMFWWWEWVDTYISEDIARTALKNLRAGQPKEGRIIVESD